MKLFMFYIGGDCGNSNVELHDVRFSVGATADDCHDDLRSQWWGDPKRLHLDCWGEIEQADGHDLAITTEPPAEGADKLFFVNLGGYDPKEFCELHRNILLIAADAKAATTRAMTQIESWALPHKDNVFEVDKAIDITAMINEAGHFISLTKAKTEKPFTFTCDYVPIGR